MDIKYKIIFYNNWHCGSGLSSGADVDLLVIKDKNNLPFIPGKTIKGLVKEAMTDIFLFENKDEKEMIKDLFGIASQKEEKEVIEQGCLFFTNACLSDEDTKTIVENNVQDYLYDAVSSTAIEEDGVAKDHSLRRMEVTVPCELYGEILNVPAENLDDIENALKYIKRLGQNRNRGLGRCDISIVERKEEGQ